ncbi:hypothetical protein ACMU_17340 [Actibacterium mucosum KCTC 23349]|uniref:YhdP central domain-containing protein n=1 Tax=Actibacterium mucosum KCTC 23349 TaxID=1454373 RepID=A0A037ZFU6_9RHOB|nr:AsmA-like C-terminal region-containing protein [Actibacterium mucosum]KAJ54473.1 hypothetical protein ACMU_17340 [Actibacterium mucosum KCTC 23349]
MIQFTTNLARHCLRCAVWGLSGLVMAALVVLAVILMLPGRTVSAPGWVTTHLEQQLNQVTGPVRVDLGGADLFFESISAPRLALKNVSVIDGNAQVLAEVPSVEVVLETQALLRRQIEVRRLSLQGADVVLRRARTGGLQVALGESDLPSRGIDDLLLQVDRVLEQPVLRSLQSVTVEDLRLSYTDTRAGRRWEVRDGLFALTTGRRELSAQLFFSLTNELGLPSEVAMSVAKARGDASAQLSVSFSDLPARDIATQSPALAFLSVLDAPISGALRTGLATDGAVLPLSASLDIGSGFLSPVAGAQPIRFRSGKSNFRFDPEKSQLTFSALQVDSDILSLRADGQAFLEDFAEGWPTALVAQTRITGLTVAPDDMFEDAVQFPNGVIEAKVTLNPFHVQIGQVLLTDPEGAHSRISGQISADAEGWAAGLDLDVDHISQERLQALWPPNAVPKTRLWVRENILGGTFFDLRGAIRLEAGQKPKFSISHEFREASVRYLRTLPPVQDGSGYLTLTNKDLNVVVYDGAVTLPNGDRADVSGSVFHVPDITVKPAMGEVQLKVKAPVPGLIQLLDLPPIEVFKKAGRSTDIADGIAEADVALRVSLAKDAKAKDVEYAATAVLRNVRSETLVPNRVLSANELQLSLDDQKLLISGSAQLDGIPINGVWSQAIGPDAPKGSRVDGRVALSERAIDVFNIGLPDGMVRGEGWGEIALDLPPGDAPARLQLTSDLNRVALSVPSIGFFKPANSTGRLLVQATLGLKPDVPVLEIEAGGLQAKGSVTVADDGGLQVARFDNVRLGSWLNAGVVLTGRGKGRPAAITLQGGRLDLRGSPILEGSGRGGAPVTLRLDRLAVSDGILLADVRGDLTPVGGLNGKLTAQVAGGGPIVATLAPATHGTAIRVQSDNAGAVLRGAGIFKKSQGGTMDLVLTPRPEKGQFDGRLQIRNTTVQDAPALASLLSAISVVGILEQMAGGGLIFGAVNAEFRLTPNAVQIKTGAATGPSLGISLSGIYDLRKNTVNMRGVVSPVYLLNAIGRVISRPGEGLFGFNYSLVGSAEKPTVRVNPLSILTPGMFREIFRAPPPELGN